MRCPRRPPRPVASTCPACRSWWPTTRKTRAAWWPRCWPTGARPCTPAPAARMCWPPWDRPPGPICWCAISRWATWKGTNSSAASARWRPSAARRWASACRPWRCRGTPGLKTACARCWPASRSTWPSRSTRASRLPPSPTCCAPTRAAARLPSPLDFLTGGCKKCRRAARPPGRLAVAHRLLSLRRAATRILRRLSRYLQETAMPYSNRPPPRHYGQDPGQDSGPRPAGWGDEQDEGERFPRERHTRQSGRWGGEEPAYGRRYGERPAEPAGGGNPNGHGPQYEQGGRYPGTRDAAASEGWRSDAAAQRYGWQDPALARSQRITPKGYVRSDERVREDLCERL